MLKSYILPLSDIIQETEDAATLVMNQGLVDRVPYYAGQYLTLKVKIEDEVYYRSYSLSSSPRLDRFLAVTVKRVQGGKVSNFILDHFQKGQLVEFLRPSGNFYIETATKNVRHLVLIGGGSGITPLMSMIKGVLYHEPNSHVSLIYANRDAASIIFREQLEILKERFVDRFNLVHILSQPKENTQIEHQIGRLTADVLPDLVKPLHLPTSYWICGPAGLMQEAQTGLKQIGVDEKQIHQERFVADEEMKTRQKSIEGPTRTVNIQLTGKNFDVQVPPGSTVLEAAIAQGYRLPYSCKRGICSTCMADLEQGQVEMDNPESLLPFEIEMGKVLVCQCHPVSDDVKIRIGG